MYAASSVSYSMKRQPPSAGPSRESCTATIARSCVALSSLMWTSPKSYAESLPKTSMPASYQISVASLELHRGKRDGARRQGCGPARQSCGPTVATRGRVRLGLLVMLALSATAGCGVESLFVGSGCTRSEDSTWDIHEPADPSTMLEVEDCQVDV